MGEGQHQPYRAGAHHLHRCRDGLLHRRRQDDPVAGEEALVRECPRAPQEHFLPGRRPAAPGLLQAMRSILSSTSRWPASTPSVSE
uniref:Uncharacterized protein n=1 Tax=Arundo donax TaxID=35708 RepID=A0A0A9DIF8_ARUDO